MDDVLEEALRNEAINRRLAGERPCDIYRALNRSKSWFDKSWARYRRYGREGLKSWSRAPKHVHNKKTLHVEEAITRVRRILEERTDPELKYARTYPGRREERAREVLSIVGLASQAHHLPSELSGGEQQRVAIARALANDPPLLLADEPTGNLDTETGQRVVQLLGDLNRQGKTIVLVTHEEHLTAVAGRIVHMRDGRIVE
jgi:ABC-type cobalamin/Fe3+-siderophores transport system ATPase subunit